MTVTRAELDRLIADAVNERVGAVARRLDDAVSELRDDLHAEVTELHKRITDVHSRALRELTKQAERRTTA